MTTNNWLKMETAPKDGTGILVTDGDCVYIAAWTEKPGGYGETPGFQPDFVDDDYVLIGLCGWLPLPDPPVCDDA